MALREINLVPSGILARRHLLRHLGLWAGCLIIALGLIFGFHVHQSRGALAKKTDFTTLKETRRILGSRIEEIKRLQEELDRLNQQQSDFEAVTNNLAYSRILSKLAGMMNGHTWLTLLAIESGRDTGGDLRLQVTGFASRNEELGNLLSQLSSEPLFKDVLLKQAKESVTAPSNQDAGESVKLIQFQIQCKISKG